MADHGVPLAQLPRDSECQWFDIASIYYSEYDYIRDTIWNMHGDTNLR